MRMNKCFWPQRANSNVYKAMSKIVYVSISPKLKKKVENCIFIIFSPPFGTLRALGVRTITRKFAVKKIRTKTCSRNTIPSPLGYLYLPNCMRSKRTIIPELVTKWGAGDALHSIYYMGESSISTLPRKFAKKIEVLNLGRDSLSPI